MSSQSIHFHETWAYLRDNAKPIVPDDVHQLREVREQHAPSKAHVKRLTRRRVDVGEKPTFTPISTGDDPGGLRRKAILRAQRAAVIAAICKTTR